MRATRTAVVVAAVGATMAVLTGTACAVEPGVSTMVADLAVPWGIGFLPDGTALITERDTFKIRQLKAGKVSDVQTISEAASTGGEGGLLGLAVSPKYTSDKTVFLYYSTSTDNRVAKLVPGGKPKPIVTGIPKARYHNGGRLAFGPDGYLYATTGDATNSANSPNLNSLGGKILRMTVDGKPAPGNPFANSLVYSYGHRNVEGIAWDAAGRLFASELGENTWDELNLIQPGKNYGWPTCEGKCGSPSFVDPLLVWHTSAASPSGLASYKGNLYMASLRGARLWKIPESADGKVSTPQPLWQNSYGRLRTVLPAPDGTLWVSTTNKDGAGDPGTGDDRILSFAG